MAQAWMRHVDGTGFAVDRPAGWRVLSGPEGAFSVADPNGSAAALVRQHRMPPGRDLADWLRRDFAVSEPGLHNVRGLLIRRHGSERASASFDYGSDVLPGRAEVLAVRCGGITTLFIAAAARGDFAERLPLLRRVLDSVHWTSPRGASSGVAGPVPPAR
jgi:hypothetical protein